MNAAAAGVGLENSEVATGQLVRSLQEAIRSVLERTIPAGGRVAVLDFPTHSNVGDYAIWLGQLAYLRASGRRVAYMCAQRDYSRERLRERVGEGTILIHGGGNLGDLWPSHQDFREQVLRDFPDRDVVQLPQSTHFQGVDRLEDAKRAFSAHSRFTLLVRDANSLAFAERHFDCRVALCPDLAFALGELARVGSPTHDVVCLARTDRESAFTGEFERLDGVEVVDWVHDPTRHYRIARRAALAAPRRYRHSRGASRFVAPVARRGFQYLAESQLRLGRQLLSRGEIAVTDRLHGHILCLLMSVPHVAIDNSYGKLRSFYETWTSSSELVRWADQPAEAVRVAAGWGPT